MSNKSTISTYIKGNLGNQLFIYAAARQVQETRMGGTEACRLILDDKRSAINNRLQCLKLCDNVEFSPAPLTLKQRVVRHFLYSRYIDDTIEYERPYDLMGHTLHNRKVLQREGLILTEDCFVPVEEKLPKNVVMDGYFQSESFFPDIRNKLITELEPKEPTLPKNLPLIKEIRECDSVCITVRMGYENTEPQYSVCTVKYFSDSINLMKHLRPNCRFYLFADDVEAARAKFPLPEDTVFEQGNDPDYEKLRVMSNCKHFILSNSSFSWWTQYLSTNDDKVVIAPNHWYNVPIPCDVYQKNWISLPTD